MERPVYKSVDPKVDFPRMEEGILEYWEKNRIFEKSLENRPLEDEFIFYDGPPFATGLPHFGHFVPGAIKDIIPRYATMKGRRVERRFGWDCHGLPVEYEMEKELGISGKSEIEKIRNCPIQRSLPVNCATVYGALAENNDPFWPLGGFR